MIDLASQDKLLEQVPAPRTDAALERRHEPKCGLVWADFARELERENIALREALKFMAYHWSVAQPPHDGTAIVAVGRVICSGEVENSVETFASVIRWEKDSSGYEGWRYNRNGMTVAGGLGDEVKVDWWTPLPPEGFSPPAWGRFVITSPPKAPDSQGTPASPPEREAPLA